VSGYDGVHEEREVAVMDISKLTNKTVLVKFTGKDPDNGRDFRAVPIKVDRFDEMGIWFRDTSLRDEFAAGQLGALTTPLGDQTYIFLPLARIEWLMASDKAFL
jgi:hypothetical protein